MAHLPGLYTQVPLVVLVVVYEDVYANQLRFETPNKKKNENL